MRILVLTLLTFTVSARAQIVSDAVVSAMPWKKHAHTAYMVIENNTEKKIKLLSAKTNTANEIRFDFRPLGSKTYTRIVESFEIGPKEKIEFVPMGSKVLLNGFKSKSFKAGDKINIELFFDTGKTVIIQPEIKIIRKKDMK